MVPIIYILSAKHKPSRQQFREFYQSFLRRNPLPVHDLWPVGLADRPAYVNPNHGLAAATERLTAVMPDAVRVASARLAVALGPRRRCGLDRTLDDDGLRRTTEALWRWRWQLVDGDDDGDDFLGHVDSLEFRFVSVYCSRSAAGCQAQIAASVMATKAVTHTATAIQSGIRSVTLRSEIRLWRCAFAIVFLMFFIRLLYHIYRHFVKPAATESGVSFSFCQSFFCDVSHCHIRTYGRSGSSTAPAQRVSPRPRRGCPQQHLEESGAISPVLTRV